MTKKIISLILALALVLPLCPAGVLSFPVSAATSGTTGSCTWTLDGTKLTISGNGAMGDYSEYSSTLPWGTSITKVVIENGVTSIGVYAFNFCKDLTSVTIPDSVTSIGSYAFRRCTNLTSITIPDSVTTIDISAFSYCSGLTSITIPDSVTSIGSHAFYNCSGLTSITIPESVTKINKSVFELCTRLTSVTIPDSVTSIGSFAFYNCLGLTSVTIPDSVTSIGERAFYNCGNLKDVWYEGTASDHQNISIGSNNENLENVTWHYNSCIQNAPTYEHSYDNTCDTTCNVCGFIRAAAHVYDSVIDTTCNICGAERTLPYDSYGTTGDCFWYKKGTALTITGNGKMGDYTYDSAAPWGESITSVTIEERVTSIGEYAFRYCSSLTSVTIPASVTSIGDHVFSRCSNLTTITIPASVTSIGNSAFSGCSSLERISVDSNNSVYHSEGNCLIETRTKKLIAGCKNSQIPSDGSVTSIGDSAFFGCSNLTTITIPDSVTSIGFDAFSSCSSLTSVTIPASVTSIDGAAFRHCSSLASVTIPASVTSIGESAFYYCSSLTDVYYEGSEADRNKISIGSSNSYLTDATWHYNCCIQNAPTYEHSYDNTCDTTCNVCGFIRAASHVYDSVIDTTCNICGAERTLPYDSYGTTGDCFWYLEGTTLTISGNGAMGDYTSSFAAPWGKSITSVTIEEGVTAIGDWVFYDCSSLTAITIPASVTSIGARAFYDCSNLTTITIPASVTSIGGYAFYECSSLASVTIPDSVTSIGEFAFSYCSSLTSVTIEEGVTSIGNYAFRGCSNLTAITISASVTSIGDSAFSYCSSLASVTIEEGVTSIGEYAFYGCSNLTTITIPASVASIGSSAFSHCSSLTSVTIPASVTSIGDWVFSGCSSLASVAIPASVTSIGYEAFSNCSSLTDVYYEGSETDRNRISIGSSNNSLTGATWHYDSCIHNAPTYEHTFDNACDGECNTSGCDFTRIPADHNYDNDLDTSCKECGFVRVVATALTVTAPSKMEYQVGESLDLTGLQVFLVYSDGSKEALTEGYEITGFDSIFFGTKNIVVSYGNFKTDFQVTVLEPSVDENAPQLVVEKKQVLAGNNIQITISLKNNPGITSAKLNVHYDPDVLTLVKVTDGGILGTKFHKPELSQPYALNWVNDAATTDFTADGVLVTLTFQVKDDAELGMYPITVTYDYDNYDIINNNIQKVNLSVVSGGVEVTDMTPGDLNSDGVVNALDRVILIRHLAEWQGYEADTFSYAAADLNNDGIVNALDRVILIRHLAEWQGYETLPM